VDELLALQRPELGEKEHAQNPEKCIIDGGATDQLFARLVDAVEQREAGIQSLNQVACFSCLRAQLLRPIQVFVNGGEVDATLRDVDGAAEQRGAVDEGDNACGVNVLNAD